MSGDWLRRRRPLILLGVAAAAALLALGDVVGALLELCVGGAALAFVLLPLVKLLSRRMKRSAAILASYAIVSVALIGVVVMLVPVLAGQAQALMRSLPGMGASIGALTGRLSEALDGAWAADGALPGATLTQQLGARLEELPGQIVGALGGLLSGTATMVSSVADGVGRFSLMVILGYYFLKDRERMLMQLELMLPSTARARVIAACGAIQRELSGYVRGQLLISAIVGAITAAGLAILRVPSFLVLGLIMAAFNLIPYFGAILGAIPIVLLTLSMGWLKVLEVAIMLFVAQQVENMVIAPRVTGRTTGLHPVVVILSLTAGGYLGGVMGMVFAIPGAIVARGVLREAVLHGDAREGIRDL